MPLLKFHIYKGRTLEEINLLLDTAHDAMVRSFNVPDRDRYQILNEHDPSHFRALDTGLDIPRTGQFLLVEVVSRPRKKEEKIAFYDDLCRDLQAKCGIASSDVMISFIENTDEDWSFGFGRAQFVTKEL
ncbi:tautomerase family protein [Agrobacterium tumefaciens]|uniref:tautomerase family protein n=1 Tax=Agrobacterium tumefaciens TaxID=358 RepID=UPI0015734864|nr:tautomerase family protein [Agrobacterium tumefaciens]NTB97272.1 tautomerase family protein [Agrobacterium tumefaciens]NTC45166.1 tautomerase family protein [Agrobacterium tumefaciens]